MPAKEIKELRQAGKLEEALNLAKTELQAEPDNIWPMRNISWVYYDYLKQNSSPEKFDQFIFWLNEIGKLHLPVDEKMLFDQLCWQIGKMAFSLLKVIPIDHYKGVVLFEAIKSFNFTKPSEGYSFLFKGLHKLIKETNSYVQFADWWEFENFRSEDFQKDKLPNGKEVMAIVEQAYIAYAKHLLPIYLSEGGILSGEVSFDVGKVQGFLPKLNAISEQYPQYQYPGYFQAKLLLALGDTNNLLGSLLPFAKKKRNDFWVWEILAEAFSSDPEKVFACYCKALSCISPNEMLVSLRQKMARLLISRKLYNESRTEIDLLVRARTEHEFKIPAEVTNWKDMEWYKTAVPSKSNFGFYKSYIPIAEALLFSDVPEESIIVEFVNADKKMLNFIASETKVGFFKYDRFLSDVKVGDTLKVRFQGGSNEGMHQVYTAIKVNDDTFKKQFMKEVPGVVRIPDGKPFGFMDDVFIHPSLVTRYKLTDGMKFTGKAIKSYNQEKKQWGWKLF